MRSALCRANADARRARRSASASSRCATSSCTCRARTSATSHLVVMRHRHPAGTGGGRVAIGRAGAQRGRQRRPRLVGRRDLGHVLLQEGLEGRPQRERPVGQRVGAADVGADLDQFLDVGPGVEQAAGFAQRAAFWSARRDRVGDPRDRREHVDRRKVTRAGELAVEHDVAVENRPGGVGDRLVVVIAFDQHGVEAGDAADRRRRRRARAAAAASRTPTAGSPGSPAARPPTGRSRAGRRPAG